MNQSLPSWTSELLVSPASAAASLAEAVPVVAAAPPITVPARTINAAILRRALTLILIISPVLLSPWTRVVAGASRRESSSRSVSGIR
jgi:hypothetical protein